MPLEAPRWRLFFQGLAVLWAVLSAGCGAANNRATSANQDTTEASSENASSSQSSVNKTNAIQVLELKTYTLEQLPAVRSDESLYRLDGGRITVAPPGEWQFGSKQKNIVCRFYLTDREGLPRIVVRSEPTVVGEIKDVTAENVVAYAEEVAKDLEAKGKKPQENLRPLILGENPWVRYVKKARYPRGGEGSQDMVDAEWQVLQTVRGGRTYYVDWQVLAGKLATETTQRDAAYAVAGTMKFLEPGSSAPAGESATEEK
jgi:hypothetical protein